MDGVMDGACFKAFIVKDGACFKAFILPKSLKMFEMRIKIKGETRNTAMQGSQFPTMQNILWPYIQ